MDRKGLLLKLCERIAWVIDVHYYEDDWSKAVLGEVLATYGRVLADIGWLLTWANEEAQNKVFEIIEDAFKREHLLKCRLEEWLRIKIKDVVNEVLWDEEEQKETKQTQKAESEELPF
jgi:hypothetical protein